MLGGIGMNNKAEYTPEKVVDISNLSREDWLEYRKKGIGGSDVAAIMGISPFATIRDGRAESMELSIRWKISWRLYHGQRRVS